MTYDCHTHELVPFAHTSPEITDDSLADLLWLQRAAALRGPWPLVMALLLLLESRRQAHRGFVIVLPDTLGYYQLDGGTAHRSLRQLEQAGMIQVWSRRGSPPLVTIVDTPADDGIVPADAAEQYT